MEDKLLLDKISELNVKYEKVEERIREIERDKSLNDYQFKQIMSTLEMLQKDITELKEKPAKRWDIIITGIITAVVTFLMGFLLKK